MNSDVKEILLIMQEECAEVTQAVSKCFRFGLENRKTDNSKTNKEHLEEELGDLVAMITLLEMNGVINWSNIERAKLNKFNKLSMWSDIKIK